MTITCGKLIAFLNNDYNTCSRSHVANKKRIFRRKSTRFEGCRIYVRHKKWLSNCQVYYGEYEIYGDCKFKGTINSYSDSTSAISKQTQIGVDAYGTLKRQSYGNDYQVRSELIKKTSAGDCGDSSTHYVIEKRSVLENFNERYNVSLYVLSYRNGVIKVVYDKEYNIESIAIFIDPLSNSTQTFDSELNQLVENILNKVSTWDSDKNRFVNKNNYDDIDAEVEIAELTKFLKKYN